MTALSILDCSYFSLSYVFTSSQLYSWTFVGADLAHRCRISDRDDVYHAYNGTDPRLDTERIVDFLTAFYQAEFVALTWRKLNCVGN